jgi:hypothetical protein
MNDCGGITICKSSQVAQNAKVGPNPVSAPVAGAQVLDANPDRVEVAVQNIGTSAVYIGKGFLPTATQYSIALNAGASLHDGNGGYWSSLTWKGALYIAGATAGAIVALSEEV